jgi:hypothetical protein
MLISIEAPSGLFSLHFWLSFSCFCFHPGIFEITSTAVAYKGFEYGTLAALFWLISMINFCSVFSCFLAIRVLLWVDTSFLPAFVGNWGLMRMRVRDRNILTHKNYLFNRVLLFSSCKKQFFWCLFVFWIRILRFRIRIQFYLFKNLCFLDLNTFSDVYQRFRIRIHDFQGQISLI